MKSKNSHRIAILLVSVASFAAQLLSNQALAFHLGDHVEITKQALKEFAQCYPGILRDDEAFFLLSSNLDEDTNLIRKDLLYSHFYNPTKTLDMFRSDSSVRVQKISNSLKTRKNVMQAFIDVGHALHHIQDMASPAHSVPVFHGPNDGFERYQVQKQAFATNRSCQDLEEMALQVQNLPTLLKKAATESLQTVSNISLPIQKVDSKGVEEYRVDGNSFWQPSSTNEFGTYGPLGRHFGKTEVQFKDAKVIVPLEFYETFKNGQMQKAVINSWIALYQLHQPKSSEMVHRFSAKDVNPFSALQMETYRRLAELFYF